MQVLDFDGVCERKINRRAARYTPCPSPCAFIITTPSQRQDGVGEKPHKCCSACNLTAFLYSAQSRLIPINRLTAALFAEITIKIIFV